MGVGQLYPLKYYHVPVHLVPQWGWSLIVLGIVQRRDNHPKCGRNWYACVTNHGHCSGGGAMLVWWPGGAHTLKIPWISISNLDNHSIQVAKSRRWITLSLWESQWVETSRRLVAVGILRLLIQLHGYISLEVNLLGCVNCYCRTGKLPSPIGHANGPVG